MNLVNVNLKKKANPDMIYCTKRNFNLSVNQTILRDKEKQSVILKEHFKIDSFKHKNNYKAKGTTQELDWMNKKLNLINFKEK